MDKPASNTYRPVTIAFSNVYGDNPNALPVPGTDERLGVKPPRYANDGTRYMLCDGSIWEYKGISAYKADNDERVNGWQMIWKPVEV